MLCPYVIVFFFLMIRRPPRSTLDRSSAASDVYKRQGGERLARFGGKMHIGIFSRKKNSFFEHVG